MNNYLLPIFVLAMSLHIGISQSSIDASGSHAKSSNFSFSYSVGEINTSTLKSVNGNYFATAGVIQPDPVLIIDVKDAYLFSQLLFPNPVNHLLHFFPGLLKEVHYTIYSMIGTPIKSDRLSNNMIDVNELEPGSYILIFKAEKSKIIANYKFVKL